MRTVLPGVILATLIALAATKLSQLPVWPVTIEGKHPIEPLLLAIIVGLVLANWLRLPAVFGAGADFCLKTVLAWGIVGMGVRLNFFEVERLGGLAVILVVVIVLVAISLSLRLARYFGIQSKLAALLAAGCTICGGTAIVTVGPVINADKQDEATAIGSITLLGLLAMFLYPAVGRLVGLTETGFGLWAGIAVHNTPQVIAAGLLYSPHAGEIATTVKMVRNLFILPVVLYFGSLLGSRSGELERIKWQTACPPFIIGFGAMAILRTLTGTDLVGQHASIVQILTASFQIIENISQWLILIAMAGLGLRTRLAGMSGTFGSALASATFTTLVVGLVGLGLIWELGLN